MVHSDKDIISFKPVHLKGSILSREYFSLFFSLEVYITRKSREMASAKVDPRAAPAIPMAGRPSFPKIRIQFSAIFDTTRMIELTLKTLVSVVPT